MRSGREACGKNWHRIGGLIAASILALAVSGCGNGLAQVTGAVTLDGQPLRGGNGIRATVFFHPQSATGTGGVGVLDESGQYRLYTGSQEGVAPADYVVTCSASQIIPAKTPGGAPSGKPITPARYANARTSGFAFTVAPGANELDLPLTSDAANGRLGRSP